MHLIKGGNKMNLKRVLFYILSFTWGICVTLIGLIIILFSIPFKKVHSYHGRLYAVWGKNWGGFSAGPFFVIGENCEGCNSHECGHGLQNIIFGPFMIFLVCIPSIVRYWYLELKYYRQGKVAPKPYDSIWFEHMATAWGKKYIETDRW